MSEQRQSPPPSDSPHAIPAATAATDNVQDDLFADPGTPTDDSLTVISKNHPKPASVEAGTAHDLRGRMLAHFELIEPIGVGGMAAVLRARDTQLDRLVALKILPPEMARDP